MAESLETFFTKIQDSVLYLTPEILRGFLEPLSAPVFFGLLIAGTFFLIWSVIAAVRGLLGRPVEDDFLQRDEDEEDAEEAAEAGPPVARPLAKVVPFEPPQRAAQPQPVVMPAPRRAVAFAPEPAPPPREDEHLVAAYERALQTGDRAASAGDFRAALASYREALEHARGLALAQVDQTAAQRRVAKALLKSGDASARLGDKATARQWHEQAQMLLRRLYASDSSDVNLAREYAVTLERTGSAAVAAGDTVAARQAFEEELRVVGSIAHKHPADPQWARFRAVVHVLLGNLNEFDSRRHYEQALALFHELERSGVIQQDDARTLAQLRQVLNAA